MVEVKKGLLIVVSGASGSGKTTLCRMVSKQLGFYYGVSHTTRVKRASEVDGRDYYFVSQEQFQKMIDNNEFLEWAKVYGNSYGTSGSLVETYLKKGQGVILDVDTQGARNIKARCDEAILIFIKAPSMDALGQRLRDRGTESEEMIHCRLSQAQTEESFQNSYDHIIINKDLEKAYKELESLIVRIRNLK